ncbi:MAG: electron transfer flavoprotein subunit beta/FixA family protein [Desulfurococcaceae archaeon]
MNIIVCVKSVPITIGAELMVDGSKKRVVLDGTPFDINEWDEYALEEAVRLKERLGGNVTVVTVSSRNVDDVILKCLAKGADRAIKIVDESIQEYDAYAVARILHAVIKNMNYDLILCGAQAGDDGYALIGVMLASLLEIPYATMARKLELINGYVRVTRELEEGFEEVVEVKLPALLTIQTGINEPRYASIMSIRRAKQKDIISLDLKSLGIIESDFENRIEIQEFFIPEKKKECIMLHGDVDEIVTKVVEVLMQRGARGF